MTIIQRNTKVDLTGALNDEIEYLRNLPDEQKDKLNPETLDPTTAYKCFLAQLFDSGASDGADAYRKQIGVVPFDAGRSYTGYMTPLEVWSAEEWEKGNEDQVLQVFKYIKGADKPSVKMD